MTRPAATTQQRPTQLVPLSPVWWCDRLYKSLVDRQPVVEWFDQYYRGDHPLPWLPMQIQDIARRILKMTRTNYMGLVVDATVERQEVLGFRVGSDAAADKEAWRIWQANKLDALSGEAFLEATKCGCSYLLVAPNPADPKTPKVTVEHPAQVIVEYEPGNIRERSAGLKVWYDDRVNLLMATLYLPNGIYKFQGKKGSKPAKWVRREVQGEAWPAPNPLGKVPIVELRNNPQSKYENGELSYLGVSELTDVTDIQDRINKTIADRLVTQDFGAFPQKWATGWAEDPDDPDGDDMPPQIAAGQPGGQSRHPAGRVNFGRDRIVVANDPDVTFGEFGSAPLDPYSGAKNEDVKDIAARTRTPSQYLLGEMINISGEALQSAESGLVSKVLLREKMFGEDLEETIQLMLLAAGDSRASETVETIWRDPQFRTIAQLTDAVIKRHLSGLISWRQSMEDLGYTPAQITSNRAEKRADALAGAVLNFDGLFNKPQLGAATSNSMAQTPAGATPTGALGTGQDVTGQTAAAPTQTAPAGAGR